MLPSVTILVPVYGVEQYIAQCAESLFQQTYKEIEYIFCDDCTPDRSIEILHEVIDKYPERSSHVKIIKNERNMGIGGTRAHLLSELKGDSFFFADSDDILPKNAIEILARRMEETDADVVEGAYQEFANGKTGSINLPCHDRLQKYIRKVQVGNLLRHQVWGRLYKTDVIRRVPDLFVEGIDMAEDYCAMTRLVAVTTRAWTDDVVYFYRAEQHSFYTHEKKEKNILSRLHATRKVLSFYHQRGHLPLTVEIGILDAFRICHEKNNVSAAMIDEELQYVPEHLMAKMLYGILYSSKIPYAITNVIYKAVRLLSV